LILSGVVLDRDLHRLRGIVDGGVAEEHRPSLHRLIVRAAHIGDTRRSVTGWRCIGEQLSHVPRNFRAVERQKASISTSRRRRHCFRNCCRGKSRNSFGFHRADGLHLSGRGDDLSLHLGHRLDLGDRGGNSHRKRRGRYGTRLRAAHHSEGQQADSDHRANFHNTTMSSAARPSQVLSVVSQCTASSICSSSGDVKDQDDSLHYCAPASSIRRSKRCAGAVGHQPPTRGCTAATVGCRGSRCLCPGLRPVRRNVTASAGSDSVVMFQRNRSTLAPAYHRGHSPCRPGIAAHHEAPVGTNLTRCRLGRGRTRRRPATEWPRGLTEVEWMSCTLCRRRPHTGNATVTAVRRRHLSPDPGKGGCTHGAGMPSPRPRSTPRRRHRPRSCRIVRSAVVAPPPRPRYHVRSRTGSTERGIMPTRTAPTHAR